MRDRPTHRRTPTDSPMDELRALLKDSGHRVTPSDDGTLHLRLAFGNRVRIRRSAGSSAVYRVSRTLSVLRSSDIEAEAYRLANRISRELSGAKCVVIDQGIELIHESIYATPETFVNSLNWIMYALNDGASVFHHAFRVERAANDAA